MLGCCWTLTHSAVVISRTTWTQLRWICTNYLVMVVSSNCSVFVMTLWGLWLPYYWVFKTTWWACLVVTCYFVLLSVVLSSYRLASCWRSSWLVDVKRLLQALVGLIVGVKNILKLFLFQVVSRCCSVMIIRRGRSSLTVRMNWLQHADTCLILGSP